MDRIAEKVGAYLLQEGHTRESLAAELGITRPTLNSRLRGESDWMLKEIIKLAEITHCTPNDLVGA